VFGAGSTKYRKMHSIMNDIRYGIFLRPDPQTCWAVAQVTLALRQQFGFVAAEVFAPHATLIGNLQVTQSEDELVGVLNPVFEQVHPIAIYNHGVRANEQESSVRYDINLNATGDRPNAKLAAIAAATKTAVLPHHIRHNDFLAPNVEEYTFAAHLSLASFELDVMPHMFAEVFEYTIGLPIHPPSSFVARWYTLFQFRADWHGQWWDDMTWRHIKSWEAKQ
jgi:hypothetical protein